MRIRNIVICGLFAVRVMWAPDGTCGEIVFTPDRGVADVPVEIVDNVVYLPVGVGESEPVPFVLDTGAPELCGIDSERANALGLSTGRAGGAMGAGSEQVRVRPVDGVILSLPGLFLTGFRVVTVPLKRMEPYWGTPKEGLIGGNVLSKLVTCVDYERRTVSFADPALFSGGDDLVELPLEVADNTLFLRAVVDAGDGGKPFAGRFIVDTAVRMTFFNAPFVRRHRLIERSPATVENITGFGLGGRGYGKVGRIGSLRMGDFVLDGPVVELTTDNTGLSASDRFDGIIGADILSRFGVCFDYGRERLLVRAGSNFAEPFEYDMSGLYWITDGASNCRFEVAHVIEGSPADVAGLQEGDVLVTVGDRPASTLTLQSLKGLLRRRGKEVALVVERGGERRDFTLVLRPLV